MDRTTYEAVDGRGPRRGLAAGRRGITVEYLDDDASVALMERLQREKPELWREDIALPPRSEGRDPRSAPRNSTQAARLHVPSAAGQRAAGLT